MITRFSATVPFGEKGGFTSSEQVVYNFGTTAVSDAKFKDVIYTVPLRGTVRYPTEETGSALLSKERPAPSGGYPVVVFLHGMHDDSDLNNAKGYDYLQKDLAENGYVALSIDAGKINGQNNYNASDQGALARGQLLMTTLDLLRAGNTTGIFNGVELAGLKGKLDLARIGILGHSRGAEAVAYAVELNRQRIGISYENVEVAHKLRDELGVARAERDKAQKLADQAKAVSDAAAIKLDKAKAALIDARCPPTTTGPASALPINRAQQKTSCLDAVGKSPSASPGAPGNAGAVNLDTKSTPWSAYSELESTPWSAYLEQARREAQEAQAKLLAATTELEKARMRLRDAEKISLKYLDSPSAEWLKKIDSPNALERSGVVLPSNTEAPHNIRAVFSLAPINNKHLAGVTYVPFATLLPTCDGDVSSLAGAQIFDDSRDTAPDENAPKFQIVVRGANHNFYNSYWAESDDLTNSTRSCRPGLLETLRLSPSGQRRNGAFLMESFMRYFVGDEIQFAPYWKGQAPTPAAGCPAGEASCDERIALTIHQPSSQRKLLQNFRNADSSNMNPNGLLTVFEKFQKTVQCRFLGLGGTPARLASCTDPVTSISAQSLFTDGPSATPSSYKKTTPYIWSVTDQAQMTWDAAGSSMTVNTGDFSAAGFDTLSFRIAVVAPIGQEVEISVLDTKGNAAILKGSDFSDALYNVARKRDGLIPLIDSPEDAIHAESYIMRPLLNMVAVPLKAFTLQGVDLTHIQQVKLRFPKGSGSVAVTDLQLQRMD